MQKHDEFKNKKSLHERSLLSSSIISNMSSPKGGPIRIQFRRKMLINDPVSRFRKLTLLIIQLNKAVSSIKKRTANEELKVDRKISNSEGMAFDLNYYKRQKGIRLNEDALKIFKVCEPSDRTDDQINVIIAGINEVVPEFTDFPIKMRKEIARVSSYQEFEEGRVIIRQNHKADNFYFIINGVAAVLKSEYNHATSVATNKTVAFLGKGKSFGELAIMNASARNATVVCHTDVAVLSIGRDDFIDIFMRTTGKDEPEFITTLRQVELLKNWPIEKLPYNNPNICLITFFRRGVIMCRDNYNSDWIYCVTSGVCRIIKKIDVYDKRTHEKFDPFLLGKHSIKTENKRKTSNNFLEVKKLLPKEVFGLSELIFDNDDKISCSLVSEGAEVVLINKDFFLRYLTEKNRNSLKKMLVPYPTDYSLEKKIQTDSDWKKFKKENLKRVLKKRETLKENRIAKSLQNLNMQYNKYEI